MLRHSPRDLPLKLLDLPPEIHLHIARYLDRDCDLAALVRTCRHLNPLLADYLYSRLVREGKGPEILSWASIEASSRTVARLLDKGIDIETKADDGATPLLAAALGRSEKCFGRYAYNGFGDYGDLSECTVAPSSPQYLEQQYETVEMLLKRGADVNAGGKAVLFCASNSSNPELIPLLVRHGASLEAIDGSGYTALQWAVKNGYLIAAKVLVECGADVNSRKRKPWEIKAVMTKLKTEKPRKEHVQPNGIGSGGQGQDDSDKSDFSDADEPFTEEFEESDGELDIDDFLGFRGYSHDTLAEKREMILRRLREDNLRKREPGDTCLHRAAKRRNPDILKLLLAHGADVTLQNKYGHTPLHSACIKSKLDSVKILLAHGACVNSLDSAGQTPLHRAVNNGQAGNGDDFFAWDEDRVPKRSPDLIHYLLDKGADIEAITKRNWNMSEESELTDEEPAGLTPLQLAVFNGHTECVRVLLQRGVDVHALSVTEDRTALHYAAAKGNPDIIRLLLENGAAADLEVEDGTYCSTPLLLAAGMIYCRDTTEAVKLLVKAGANVNTYDEWGISPLIAVCKFNMAQPQTVMMLLKAGAVVNVEADNGTSALVAACENGHVEIVQMLLKYGADVEAIDDDCLETLQQAPRRLWDERNASNNRKILSMLVAAGLELVDFEERAEEDEDE